jgi:CheY-like chemotaxis protein/HPt (histidine-containing phosphotransfer) domain-containing protein
MASDAAENADEALEMLRSAAEAGRPYEVAVLDLMMPGMDGIELAARISADPRLGSVRLIMLASGLTRRGEAEAAGIRSYLTKPARQSLLYDAVANAAAAGEHDRLEGPESTPVVPGPVAGGAPILIAEDNAVNQAVAEAMLARRGHPVHIVNNGREAVEAVSTGDYAAVLMDCQMPEMDGYAATAEIRRREGAGRHIPIIAMTAHSMKGDRERCLEAGMDDYLSKPLRPDALEAALERWAGAPEPAAGPVGAGNGNGANGNGGVDLGTLERLRADLATPGREHVVDAIVAQYLQSAPSRVAAIRAGLDRDDPEAAAEEAHALKGASATFGAVALADLCSELERAGRAGDLERARALMPDVERAATDAATALQAQLGAEANPAR